MPVNVHEVTQGSDDWHELRAGKFTGSNAHKLLKYGALDYSLTETGKFRGNFYTKRGHILEDEAIELYEKITNTTVDRPGFVTNSAYPMAGYSPDGLTETVVVEVKCFNQEKHLAMFSGDVPLEVLAQVHFGMLICERKLANIIIYNPELDAKRAFKIIAVPANRNIQNNFKRILGSRKEMVTV